MNIMDIDKHSSRIKTINTLGYVGLLLWVPVLFMTVFIFSSHGTASALSRWLGVIFIWLVPISFFYGSRLSKKSLTDGNIKAAYYFISVPTGLLYMPTIAGILLMITGIFVSF